MNNQISMFHPFLKIKYQILEFIINSTILLKLVTSELNKTKSFFNSCINSSGSIIYLNPRCWCNHNTSMNSCYSWIESLETLSKVSIRPNMMINQNSNRYSTISFIGRLKVLVHHLNNIWMNIITMLSVRTTLY